jgi:PLP dependent protein
MTDVAARIAENVAEVRGRIAEAAVRSGRKPDAVALVAVTKYVSADLVRPLVAAGCWDLGESRPQKLWEKADELAGLPVRWHMIGHIQTNKIRRTLPLVALIHSIDSQRLLDAIDKEQTAATTLAACGDGPVRVLLEVNVSGDAAKGGFAPDAIEPLLEQLASYRSVSVGGLMCMAGLESEPNAARREFASLRELRDRLRASCRPNIALNELSMGMSGDYEIAIEEGATIVRIGSALFDGATGQ